MLRKLSGTPLRKNHLNGNLAAFNNKKASSDAAYRTG